MRVVCPYCSQALRVRDEHFDKTIRCPVCEAVVLGPSTVPPTPAATAPRSAPPASGSLLGLRCPSCGAGAPEDAVICVHCGLDFRSGKRLASRAERLADHVDTGMPLVVRAVLCVVLAVALTAMISSGNAETFDWEIFFFLLLPFFAVLLGTFSRIGVGTDPNRASCVRKTFFVAFVPVPMGSFRADAIRGLYTSYRPASDPNTRLILGLLFLLGFLPGILWWWFLVRRELYILKAAVAGRRSTVRLYRGGSERAFRHAAAMIESVAPVRCQRV